MAVKRDYYEVLGIDRNATDEDIRRAFRKLAFQYHPDRNADDGATEKFKELNEAYEVLSSPDKRATYDRFGHVSNDGGMGQGFEGFGFNGFGDIFDAFFGGASATATRQGPRQGNNLQHAVTLTLEEAAFGCDKEIKLNRIENCSMCHGTGCKPGTRPVKCTTCNGSGQVRRVQQSIFGRFINVAPCDTCNGEGQIIIDACPQCRGSGREKVARNLTITIPHGVDNGSQLRLSREGDAGVKGGQAGDLYLNISVLPHELFTREEDDIYYELPVNFAQAALGDEVEVPTLNGKVKLKIPSGAQSGKQLRLKDKGVGHLRGGGRGDQIVKLRLVTPEKLTKEQKKLFEELAKSMGNETLK